MQVVMWVARWLDGAGLTHLTRAAAVAAYGALSLATLLGMLRALAARRRGGGMAAFEVTHQTVTLLAMALVALHLVALALNPQLPFAAWLTLAPVGDAQRPVAHALAAVSLYSLVVVGVSSWLRRALPYGLWRGLHGLGFVAFFGATLHGLLAGPDAATPWMRGVYLVAATAVAALTLARLGGRMRAETRQAPATTRAAGARRG